MLDGDLMFVVFLEGGRTKSAPCDPPLPDLSLQFVRDGEMLRVKIVPRNVVVDREGHFSKRLLAKDGWYVTADFSTKPPQVILTEKPTEHSRWTFAWLPAGDRVQRFIKNEDAPGKTLWLSMEEKGTTYRGGIARKPVLSTETKDYFWIGDANEGK